MKNTIAINQAGDVILNGNTIVARKRFVELANISPELVIAKLNCKKPATIKKAQGLVNYWANNGYFKFCPLFDMEIL